MTDPIADMLTRIRNAITARKAKVIMPASKMKARIAEVLKDEGFVGAISSEEDGKQGLLSIELRYDNNNHNAIQGIRRVSKPGQRTYARHTGLPKVRSGLGIAILTTSKGVMTEREARKQGLGGELLCEVW
ncbi:MAG TPA: 30S ribosomal protein S8 [Polyangia bacterium]|jgi:small subunit ribosomal protein S8